jgi:gamma-hexachlorocyclohexane dehydrochlorinase
MPDDDLIARIERLETERELARLVSNYCHGIDRRDIDLFLSIWSEDAVYQTNTPFGDYTGKTDIERGVRETMWKAFSATHHWTVNLVTEIDGDTATGLSNLTQQGVLADGNALICAATYHDSFGRFDGKWLITQRVIETHHFAPLPGVDWSPPRWA